MPKAISYIRFSSGKQAKGSSIQRQQEMVEKWLKANPDIPLDQDISYTDEAISAYKGDHLKQGLGLILAAIETGSIKAGDYLLIEKLDRLSRQEPLDLQQLIIKILQSGVVLVTLEDGKQYTKELYNNDPSILFILAGAIQGANLYSKTLSRRVAASYDAKRTRALEGKQIARFNPMWLKSNGKLKQPQAEMLKGCIDLYLQGKSHRNFVESYPELSKHDPRSFIRWFSNPALIGHWIQRKDKTLIENVFEPLITPVVFEQLQQQLKRNSLNMPDSFKTHLTSGLVKCNECGKSFITRRIKYKQDYFYYANCSGYIKRGRSFCTNHDTWPSQMLELIVKESFKSIQHLIKQPRLLNEDEVTIADIQARLNLKHQQLNNIAEMIMNGTKGDQIKEKNNQLVDEAAELEFELASIKQRQRTKQAQQEELKLLSNKYTELKDKLFSDHAELRQSLMKIGFRITIQNKLATVTIPDYNLNSTFEHCGRSTKYKCYFLLQRQLNNLVDYNHTVLSLDNEPVSQDEIKMHKSEQSHFIEGRTRQHVLFKDHADYADLNLNDPLHGWKELTKTLIE